LENIGEGLLAYCMHVFLVYTYLRILRRSLQNNKDHRHRLVYLESKKILAENVHIEIQVETIAEPFLEEIFEFLMP
jgi:hypothetical protein